MVLRTATFRFLRHSAARTGPPRRHVHGLPRDLPRATAPSAGSDPESSPQRRRRQGGPTPGQGGNAWGRLMATMASPQRMSSATLPDYVKIVEVGPRDGLQVRGAKLLRGEQAAPQVKAAEPKYNRRLEAISTALLLEIARNS